jgi:hypothetical protein
MRFMRLKPDTLGGILLVAIASMMICGPAPAQTTKPDYYPANSDGLTEYFKDMLHATVINDQRQLLLMCQALIIPKPMEWFQDVFGKETGTKLAETYEKDMKDFGPSLARLFLNLNDPKNLQVVVTRIESLEDPQIKLAQTYVLEAMRKPVTLYSVVIKKDGSTSTIGLWSFVYADNNFRLAGKMLTLQEMAKGRK